jgi:Cu(I)/Ag(I) efflux system membrane fusion protein
MSDLGFKSESGETGGDRSRRGTWLTGRKVLVGAGLLIVVFLLLAVPLQIHPVAGWIHGVLGRDDPAADPAGDPGGKQLWTCGMHPQVIEDHPGQCPICKMDLVPLRTSAQADETPASATVAGGGEQRGKILFYRNPMDPTITSPVPRKDEMGMDYVPVYADEATAAAAQGATVTIDPVIVQNMNVTMATVERHDVQRRIRTVGYLDYDQEKMVSITTKYSGFVEKVHVDYIGQPVQRGQPLLEIYSPELVQTQQELLSALQYVQRLQKAPEEAQSRAKALLTAARERLAYWDIAPDQVAELERSGRVQRTLALVSPSGGVVMQRMDGLEGLAVRPGMELLHIADLSTLWLSVEVFADQLPWVDRGSEVRATMTYFPGEVFTGRVRYIEPEVSEKTRTVRLTLEIPNRDGRLRAGMYATVEFDPVIVHDALTVSAQAVLRTGERDLVVVALGNGRFAPRQVVLGPGGDGFVQILSGLEAGEQVVTSGQFLIDSESNLRAAIQQMIAEKQY